MTEKTTTKGPVRLLADCARLSGFDPAEGWPEELPVKDVINLLAGTWKTSNEGRKEWARLVSTAINKTGKLETRAEQQPAVIVCRDASGLSKEQRFYKALFTDSNGVRVREVYKETHTPAPLHYITRAVLATWLQAIGETTDTLSACALAWLGPEWKESPPEPNATTDKPEGTIDEIPGTLPPRAAGKLAIKAAWQIECEAKRRASAKEVLALLQKWADAGEEPAVLVKSLPEKRAVQWLTTKGKHLEYTLEACEKTLGKWAESLK